MTVPEQTGPYANPAILLIFKGINSVFYKKLETGKHLTTIALSFQRGAGYERVKTFLKAGNNFVGGWGGGLGCRPNRPRADTRVDQSLVLGPFYPQIKPLDQDADLTVIKGQGTSASGQIIHVAGRILNLKGETVRNAHIEVWQADANGRYAHPSDPDKAPPAEYKVRSRQSDAISERGSTSRRFTGQ